MNTKKAAEVIRMCGLDYVPHEFATFTYRSGKSTATSEFKIDLLSGVRHPKKKNRMPAYIYSALKRSLIR